MRIQSLWAAAVLLPPGIAQAHGAGGGTGGWWRGFEHAFSGCDHLLAMLALGYRAARLEAVRAG